MAPAAYMRRYNMQMTVVERTTNKQYDVYDITYDYTGYPHFLIYDDGQWLKRSAKHFRPLTADDYAREVSAYMKNMPVLSFYDCKE